MAGGCEFLHYTEGERGEGAGDWLSKGKKMEPRNSTRFVGLLPKGLLNSFEMKGLLIPTKKVDGLQKFTIENYPAMVVFSSYRYREMGWTMNARILFALNGNGEIVAIADFDSSLLKVVPLLDWQPNVAPLLDWHPKAAPLLSLQSGTIADEEENQWSNLSRDVLETIVEKIPYSDYVRLRAVCVSWNSYLPNKRLEDRFPCLLLPPHSSTNADDDTKVHHRVPYLLNPLIGEVHLELSEQVLPPQHDLLFRGFSKGWLIAIGKTSPSIYLINPFTTHRHQLPPIYTFPDILEYHPARAGEEFVVTNYYEEQVLSYEHMFGFFIQKVVISSSNPNDLVAMAIFGEYSRLAYCKQGDKGWTLVGGKVSSGYSDVIFYKDNFYAVDCNGNVVVVSDLDSSPTAVCISKYMEISAVSSCKLYLVESLVEDRLLMVARNVKVASSYETYNFDIFLLNLPKEGSRKKPKLMVSTHIKLESLGGCMLFLGFNESLSLSSHNIHGCKGDAIYFADDYFEGHEEGQSGGFDIGVFNFNDKSFQPLCLPGYQNIHLSGYRNRPKLLWPPPIWVMHT